jgi:drug/metabolite transporter (DMT)-like permease
MSSNLRGIIFMMLSTCTFVINDTMLKLAAEGLPPFQTLFLRGVSASLWFLPVLLLTGNGPKLGLALHPWAVLRNLCELTAVACFIVALPRVLLPDITAVNQLAPMLLLIGCAIFFKERIGATRAALIGLGFVGALLVAQPGGAGFSPYLLLGFVCALASAGRDIAGRKVPATIPVMVIAYSTLIAVMLGAGALHIVFETWQAVEMRHVWLLLGSGLFLCGGQFFLFLSYRTAETGVVAPFIYLFAVWAVISGLVVFGVLPNLLALCGIGLILFAGVTIAVLDGRQRRLLVTA